MKPELPLPTLLSQVLIAYTIEHDNEFERLMMASPFRPVLVSIVMWSNFLRFVPADGVKLSELTKISNVSKPIHPSLPGMERWGYVKVGRDPADKRPKPPRGDLVVRPGLTGLKAQEIWSTLPEVIEGRWRERLGTELIDSLTSSLNVVLRDIKVELPHYLPVLMSNGFFSDVSEQAKAEPESDLSLSTILAQTLLAFTLDFERDTSLSLPLCANPLRVLDDKGVSALDLPQLTGVSKEAIAMSLTFLGNNEFVSVEPGPEGHSGKWVRLTSKGEGVQASYLPRVAIVEASWRSSHGDDAIREVRDALEVVREHPGFSDALVPDPAGWRARKPYLKQTEAFLGNPKGALPHHPMVLHRGGWPDGS